MKWAWMHRIMLCNIQAVFWLFSPLVLKQVGTPCCGWWWWDAQKGTGAMMGAMWGNKGNDVWQVGRQVACSMHGIPWIKASQRLREYYSVCTNTMDLPSLETSQYTIFLCLVSGGLTLFCINVLYLFINWYAHCLRRSCSILIWKKCGFINSFNWMMTMFHALSICTSAGDMVMNGHITGL